MKLDQSQHDKNPQPGVVSLDEFEFQHEGEPAWRTANASFQDGAVVELELSDRKVVFDGEVNDLYGVRTLNISHNGDTLEFTAGYSAPMVSESVTLSSQGSAGKILSFDKSAR